MIFPPRRSMARVEAFRRAHDPLHARIAAHLTLVFPMPRPAAVARRVARALSGVTACRIALRGAGRYPDGSIHLRVRAGASALTGLHDALGAALRAPTPRAAPAYRPHLTVARAAAEPRAARRLARAAASLAPLEFSVRAVALVQEGRHGRWTEVARFRLAAPGLTDATSRRERGGAPRVRSRDTLPSYRDTVRLTEDARSATGCRDARTRRAQTLTNPMKLR